MAIIIAFIILLNIALFVGGVVIFAIAAKTEKYSKTEYLFFAKSFLGAFVVTLVTAYGLYLAANIDNHNPYIFSAITGLPFLAALICALSYSVIASLNNKNEKQIKFFILFWGVMISSPVCFLTSSLLTTLGFIK